MSLNILGFFKKILMSNPFEHKDTHELAAINSQPYEDVTVYKASLPKTPRKKPAIKKKKVSRGTKTKK